MLALIDAGEAGLDLVRGLLQGAAKVEAATLPLSAVQLLAPLPLPRQIRDFSVFVRHIRDAPRGSARMRARLRGEPPPPDPPADEAIPEIYRQQPIYYHSNRFNVVGVPSLLWKLAAAVRTSASKLHAKRGSYWLGKSHGFPSPFSRAVRGRRSAMSSQSL